MKFGLYLYQHQFPPWKNEYLQYDQMKVFLKDTQICKGNWTQMDEVYFLENFLKPELDRVKKFIQWKINQIQSLLDQESPEDISMKVTDLTNFIKLNATGFSKIIKKHDKWTKIHLQESLQFHRIQQQFEDTFISQLNDLLLQKSPPLAEIIGKAITDYHSRQNSANSGTSSGSTSSIGKKVTTSKYWIHPDNLNEVQAILHFHLPVVNNNANSPGSNIMNTIYFEDLNRFQLYSELLQRKEAARLVRARWHGFISDVYIERMIYSDSWVNNKDMYQRERIDMKHPLVRNYLSDGEYLGPQKEIANSIFKDDIQNLELKSVLRCYQHRTTYQKDHNFCVSLDTKIAFVKEIGPDWRRSDIGDDTYPFDHLNSNDVYIFPYAVLETKTLSNGPLPTWLEKLLASSLVYEIPYFSKYLHGASHFYRNRLAMLPWWLHELDKDIRRKVPNTPIITIQPSQNFQRQILPLQQQQQQNINVGSFLPSNNGYFNNDNHQFSRAPIDDEEKMLMHHQTSCTATENSQVDLLGHSSNAFIEGGIRYNKNSQNGYNNKAVGSLLANPIVSKIKLLREIYHGNHHSKNNDANNISMMTWLYAKFTNNESILLSQASSATNLNSMENPSQTTMSKNTITGRGEKSNGNKKSKIEPKIHFANERTFINWLQFCALLLAVSLGLMNFGDNVSKGSGAFFIIVSIIMAGYAQLRYQYRAWQIKFRSNARFDDMLGPAVLCLVIVLALFINLGLRVSQPLPTSPSLFSYNTTTDNTADSLGIIQDNKPLVPSRTEDITDSNNRKLAATPTPTTTAAATYSNGNNGQQAIATLTKLDKHGHVVPLEEEDDPNSP
ncbi:VTC domain-containing protein [Mycotypha africana]|uniref:VTC domain-containing protein n=1 Tax=Mycotypha africana TaxID=64632 RepID=UPI0023010631|nr:VTC domain-containing protein [Mycotypha africana]KAI8987749.1 VTC domain-containing protein [Mycotypha africana]